MKRIFRIVTVFAALISTAESYAQNFTNRGKEFWVGYGHHQYMEDPDDNSQNMVLYLSAEQPASVTITIENSGRAFPPLATWSRTYNVPANTVISTEIIPKGSTKAANSVDANYDARLFDLPTPIGDGGERIFTQHGIHIVSTVPIVAYAHIYGGVASGATMLMPVETWGYSYTSINSEQRDAAGPGFSWLYVVAKDSNTRVRITPSAASRKGKPAGLPFTVDLQKGQIYQLVGQADGNGNGPQLTGTTVKSIVGADGKCHQIAVFSGSSRTGGETLTCGTGSGRDNDMQQNFPEHAWGKRYLTAPYSKASSGSLQPGQFQTSVYKIAVKDPTTVVKRNGVTLSGLVGGKYYIFSSTTADHIESDKSIMVAQFMSGTSICNGGLGDPEMVYISPLEQAISRVGFYRNITQAINVNYVTLIVPTAGLASLWINNSQSFSHTYPHPQNALLGKNYTVVIKGWPSSAEQCIVTCDSAFVGTTYGLGSAESYAYNAGTYLKNLNAEGEIYNKPDTTGVARNFTCTGTPMEISTLVAYKPTSMDWKLSALGTAISPNADVLVPNPVSTDSVTLPGGAKYYRYRLPGTYVFNTAGSYDLPIVTTSTDIDNCSLQETVQIRIEVKARPSSDFTFSHSGCRTDSVQFNGPSTTGTYTANQWQWNFGDTTVGSIRNPKKVYGATGNYVVSLVVTSTEGCLSDTTAKPVTISPAPIATIVLTAPTTCEGSTLTFSDTTTVTAGTFYWDFGTGTPRTLTSNTPQTFTYTTPGTYIVKHLIFPTGYCISDTVYRIVTIYPKPVKPVVTAPVTYCQNSTATPLSAVPLAGHTLTWYSAYPLTGGSATPLTPSTATAGTLNYYVVQTSLQRCLSDTAIIPVTITSVIANNTIAANQTVCSGSPAATLTGSTPTGGTGTYMYQWQQSTDGGVIWTNVTGATNVTFNPGILSTGTTKFRRFILSGLCTDVSNVVDIVVQTNLNNYDISASQTVCEGIVPTLLDGQPPSGGSGSYSYVWQSSPNGTTWTNISGQTGEDYQPPVLTANTYYRRITSGGNCPAISNVALITVNQTPNAAITAPTGICSNQTANVSFTASVGAAPYNIQLFVTAPGGSTSLINQTINSNAPVSINVIPINSAAGTYTVQLASLTDSRGCSRTTGMTSVNIVVTAKPNLNITGGAAPICEGTSIPLTAAGATTYIWSPSAGLSSTTGATVNANPVVNTTYQVIGTTNGCADTNTIAITVIARPAKPGVTTGVEYCLNAASIPLRATATTGNTLTWYNNASLTGGSATAPTPSTATAGTVYYYVTQTNSNNCVSDTSVVSVTIRPLPSVNFDLPAGICMPNGMGTFTNRTTIADNSNLGYAWNFGDGSGTSTATSPTYGYAASGSYIVTLTATSQYGCTASLPKTMSAFFEKPVAGFTVNPDALCQGQDNFFTDMSNPSGSTITKWQWWFGDGKIAAIKNPTHRYTQPGNYTVQLVVTTAIGCVSDTFPYLVMVYVQPRIDAGPSYVVPEGTTIQFKATANDTTTVGLLWTPPTGLSNPTSLRPTLTVRQNQTYTLTATGAGNCTAIDTMTVRILKEVEVPNAFSPNADATNDRWMIPNLADYPGAKVEVYNRWGQQVFLSYGYNKPWDGTYMGKPLPLATYYYIITLNNGFKPITGSVTIIK